MLFFLLNTMLSNHHEFQQPVEQNSTILKKKTTVLFCFTTSSEIEGTRVTGLGTKLDWINLMKSLTQIGLAHSTGQIRAAGDVIEVLRLHLLLVRLAMVEVVEVGHDDRHWQRDGEHTSDCAK